MLTARCLAVAALLGACGFTVNATGDDMPAVDAATEPGIDAIDAMIDASPQPNDQDGDGILDASDNCPTVGNGDQRDHDDDLHGDPCDRCPHLASASDPDDDMDGVGNACDPRPLVAGDTRVLFDGFYDASSLTGWVVAGGTWAVSNGTLTQTRLDQVATARHVGAVLNAYVMTDVEVTAIGSSFPGQGGNTVHPTVGTGAGVTSTQGYYCYAFRDSQDRVAALSVFPPNMIEQTNLNWNGQVAVGAKLQVSHWVLGNNRCGVTWTSGTLSQNAQTTEQVGPSVEGEPLLLMAAAGGAYDYVFVATSP